MARATLSDLASLGLPPEALRTIPTTQAPVTQTGAGGGWVVPSGYIDVGRTLVGTYAVRVRIGATGGAPGVATFQYSLDGGATWAPSAAVVTPAAGRDAPLGHTGLRVSFEGTFVASDAFAWTATSAALAALEWATGIMDSGLRDRYGAIAEPYPAELVSHEAALAAHRALAVKGFNPENIADRAVMSLEKRALEWRDAVRRYDLHPNINDTSPPSPCVALSDPLLLTSTQDTDPCDL